MKNCFKDWSQSSLVPKAHALAHFVIIPAPSETSRYSSEKSFNTAMFAWLLVSEVIPNFIYPDKEILLALNCIFFFYTSI